MSSTYHDEHVIFLHEELVLVRAVGPREERKVFEEIWRGHVTVAVNVNLKYMYNKNANIGNFFIFCHCLP